MTDNNKSLFNYDDNRYGQPIEDVTVFHDIIDARKLRSVKANSESAMFSPNSSRIIGLHGKQKEAEGNVANWIYQNYDVRQGADQRMLKALFLYLYRGTEPSFFPAEDEIDEAMEGLIEMIDNSPYADPYRKMCQLNRWHTDVIGRLIFDEIMAEAKGMMDALAAAGGSGESQDSSGSNNDDVRNDPEEDGSDQEGGSPDNKGGGDSESSDQRGGNDPDPGDKGEGDGSEGESNDDGGDGGDATKQSDGDPDPNKKASVSTNSPRQDAQTLVNRAMERVRDFTKDTSIDSNTSIDEALEAAKKLGDNESNPLVKHDIRVDMGDIADKMGRMRSMFDAEQATRIEFAPGATISLCYSNDVRNVVPSELALMTDPDLSMLFDMKYLQRRLLCRKTEGVTRGGKGPIIMCIDVSGSMDQKMLSWAMSLGGAIGYTAASQGRDVAFIYYSDTVPDIIALDYECQSTLIDLERAIESVVYNQRIGMGTPHEHSMIPRMREVGIDRVCQSNGGYTNYGCAFDAVNDLFLINQQWLKADMLFLTDGGDGHQHRLQSKEKCEALQAMGVRAFGIGLVDVDHNNEDRMEEMMKASLGYFDSYATVKFGSKYSTDDIVKQIAESL